MTIASGDTIHKFGTQTSVIAQQTALADGAFSLPAEATRWTNSDDVPKANMVIDITFGANPSANANVQLFGRPVNIFGTNNGNQPSLDFPHTYLGVFPIDTSAVNTRTAIEVELPNSDSGQQWDFYIKNNSGQSSSLFQVWARPLTVGPKV